MDPILKNILQNPYFIIHMNDFICSISIFTHFVPVIPELPYTSQTI
jgi:hypothetical protein